MTTDPAVRPPDSDLASGVTAGGVVAGAVMASEATAGERHIGALVSALTVLDTRLLEDWGAGWLRAVAAARAGGIATWCLTGPAPNPLAEACDEAVCVYPAGARALSLTATVQQAHQVALHLICLSFDTAELTLSPPHPSSRPIGPPRPARPSQPEVARWTT